MGHTSYATVAELKERVGIAADDTGSDDLLQQQLDSAARLVDGFSRGVREGYEAFGESAAEARFFDDDGSGFLWIEDATEVIAVARAGTELDTDSWMVYPYQSAEAPNLPILGIVLNRNSAYTLPLPLNWYDYPFHGSGAGQIAVTAKWGYCKAENRPPIVKEATLQQAALMVQAIGQSPDERAAWDQLHPSVAGLMSRAMRRVYFG